MEECQFNQETHRLTSSGFRDTCVFKDDAILRSVTRYWTSVGTKRRAILCLTQVNIVVNESQQKNRKKTLRCQDIRLVLLQGVANLQLSNSQQSALQ